MAILHAPPDSLLLLLSLLAGWVRLRPASRDPWGYNLTDGETGAIEREGINRLTASSLGGGRNG
jgi:hypothetical protein